MTCSQSGGELHGHSCFLRECGFLFGEVIISEVTKQEALFITLILHVPLDGALIASCPHKLCCSDTHEVDNIIGTPYL